MRAVPIAGHQFPNLPIEFLIADLTLAVCSTPAASGRILYLLEPDPSLCKDREPSNAFRGTSKFVFIDGDAILIDVSSSADVSINVIEEKIFVESVNSGTWICKSWLCCTAPSASILERYIRG